MIHEPTAVISSQIVPNTDREREAVRQQYDNRYYDDVRHNDDNSYKP